MQQSMAQAVEPTTHPLVSDTNTDAYLVERCLADDQHAWATLIGRYKRLIYSYCHRYGAHGDDAADVFQQVCAELFRALPRLRNHHSVKSWMTIVATHEAYRWKRRRLLRILREGEEAVLAANRSEPGPSLELERAQREEAVRAAVRQLPPRCQEMVKLLFYEDPPRPYQAVAGQLGLATGSIGFIRARCLRKLSRLLAPGEVQ